MPRKAKKGMAKARRRVDKAQNVMIKSLDKRLNNLEESIETKYAITQNSVGVDGTSLDFSTANDRTAQIYHIGIAPTQGLTDERHRIGDKVNLKSIQLRYSLTLRNAGAGAPPLSRVRVIMFWDKDPQASDGTGGVQNNPPEWTQLLQSVQATNINNMELAMLSTKTHDLRQRFSFIYDKVHCLTSSVVPAGSLQGIGSRSAVGEEKFYKDYKKCLIKYFSAGQINTNKRLYLAVLSTQGGGFEPPVFNYFVKTQFQDA